MQNNSTKPESTLAAMNTTLSTVKASPNGVCSLHSSDLCQVICGLPCYDHSLFQILAYLNKTIKPKVRCIKSIHSGESNCEDAFKLILKKLDCNKIFQYLFNCEHSVSVIDLTLRACYLISPQLPASMRSRRDKNTTRTKIIIIGAGIAGLAAAYKLTQAGIQDFKVLEEIIALMIYNLAQSVAGGRISSLKFTEGYVELGAQWIHGSKSMFYEFVYNKSLLSSVVSYEGQGHYLKKGGERISDSLVKEIREVIENILMKCETFYRMSRNSTPPSVGEYLKYEFERYLQSCICDSPATLQLKRELFDWHLRFQIIDNSCYTLEDLSAFDWGRFQSCGSENFNIKDNYSQIVDRLLAELPENSIEYKRSVNSVDWSNIIKVASCDHVTYNEYLADHIIVTCSVGVISAYLRSFFSPQLPDIYVKGFRSIGFGTINKIFLCYKEAWWQDIQGIQLIWDSSIDKLPIDQEKDMAWTRGVTGFDLVVGLPTVLLCWVGGGGAELVEELSDEIVAEHCTALLTLFTGNKVPHPTEIVRSKWNSNQHVRGSYSYFRVMDDEVNRNSTPQLLTPIFRKKNGKEVPTILFAGEALHEKHHSTVHGAFETGVTQADKLIDFLTKS